MDPSDFKLREDGTERESSQHFDGDVELQTWRQETVTPHDREAEWLRRSADSSWGQETGLDSHLRMSN